LTKTSVRALNWLLWVCLSRGALAQDLEPRRWTHLPAGTNFLGITYVYSAGNLEFDPVLRIEGADVHMHTAVLSYIRYFGLFDRTARLDVRLPFQSGTWDGLVDGEPREVTRDGLGDPILRLSLNLAGAPALRGPAFLEYRQQHPSSTVVGAALGMRLPLGEYMEDRLINLGQNRFSFWPQLGVVHTHGPWSYEVTGSLFLFTDNDEFFNGNKLEQDPLFSAQAHVVRTYEGGFWISGGVGYDWAGETQVNGVPKGDRSDLLLGFSFGFAIGSDQSVRMGFIRAASLNEIGSDTNNLYAGWSIRF
jgi:hypothetical protein